MFVPVEGRKDNRFQGVGRPDVGGDKEEAQLDVLSHFEHKCEWREREISRTVGHHCSPDSTKSDFFPLFSFSLAGVSDQSPTVSPCQPPGFPELAATSAEGGGILAPRMGCRHPKVSCGTWGRSQQLYQEASSHFPQRLQGQLAQSHISVRIIKLISLNNSKLIF